MPTAGLLNFSQGGFGPRGCRGGQHWALGECCVRLRGTQRGTGKCLRLRHALSHSWLGGRWEIGADRAWLGHRRCPGSSPGVFLGAGPLSLPGPPCRAVAAGCVLSVQALGSGWGAALRASVSPCSAAALRKAPREVLSCGSRFANKKV